MGEPFKNLLGKQQVLGLSRALRGAWPAFPSARFEREALAGLGAKELKARAGHVADALERALPADRRRAFGILVRAMGPAVPVEGGQGDVFRLFPVSAYLERHGPEAVQPALSANRELTQRFTAEFSIRPLIAAAPGPAFASLSRWTRHRSAHVRRLVSEGTRTRLPWAPRIPGLIEDPSRVWPLLEALKDDPSEYVRRSVANNLNDLSKDHPDQVLALCRRWSRGASRERRRLVEHALRTLVKAGRPEALALLGAEHGADLEVRARVEPARVRLGGAIRVEAVVRNRGQRPAHVVAEVRIHFVKSRGDASARAFRLGRVDVPAGASRQVGRRFALVHRTIRRLHAGLHAVEVQVNGRRLPAGRFTLVL